MMVAKAGADVNSKTHGGYTPLHLAAMHGNDRVIKVLVDDFKADINARDFSGRKPRQVAKDTLTIEAQRRLEHVLTLSDSSSESGYSSQGQQTPKYGSLNSIVTPSAALMGYYGGGSSEAPLSVAQPPAESGDKHRDRTSSLGKFLHKKKKSKDHRQPMPSTPYPSNSSAGLLIGSPIELQRMDEERRENELDMKRTQSDPNLLHDEV
ncbi:ankyrin repeat domain-containing protein SOWAHD isoform X1 [Nematostella vectensis]|uniref:ankyrin repeat domain-containing protein SOWAHD isoform X1 n=1 Tax=Nematostella vectensis TaxID=45351 RepID=UPI00139013A8|nr:ankyrin repeat domain-containing protein SOWAHD isoform X1 [Nematostella vectensis]